MRRLSVALALASLAGGAPALLADSIPYANAGSPAITSTLVAQTTGNVTGYFIGSDAGDDSIIRMVDVTTGVVSAYFFPNHSTAVGTSANFGSVNAGDILIFELLDLTKSLTLSTDPSVNADGDTHGYSTAFAGGLLGSITYPAGTYIGMEDTIGGDYDYNDNQFLFTNVAPAPEPGTLLLLGTGMLGVAGTLRRKMFAR
jgi:hypothetical protein